MDRTTLRCLPSPSPSLDLHMPALKSAPGKPTRPACPMAVATRRLWRWGNMESTVVFCPPSGQPGELFAGPAGWMARCAPIWRLTSRCRARCCIGDFELPCNSRPTHAVPWADDMAVHARNWPARAGTAAAAALRWSIGCQGRGKARQASLTGSEGYSAAAWLWRSRCTSLNSAAPGQRWRRRGAATGPHDRRPFDARGGAVSPVTRPVVNNARHAKPLET